MQLLLCLIVCLYVNCTYCMEKLLILVLSCVQSSDWLQWCRLLWELQYTKHGDRARHACVEIVKYVDLYSTSSQSASNALPFPVSCLRKPTLQPCISEHCKTTWYGLVYHEICLFTPPAWAGSGWVGLGAWFHAEVVYPSIRRSLTEALTGPGIE